MLAVLRWGRLVPTVLGVDSKLRGVVVRLVRLRSSFRVDMWFEVCALVSICRVD
jgi:hypothetical protein